jgi:hypothetical protein
MAVDGVGATVVPMPPEVELYHNKLLPVAVSIAAIVF